VLFRRAIELSVSSERWAEVATGLEGKAWGADLPKSSVMLNPQFKALNESTCLSFPWAGGQTDPLLRLCRTVTSRRSALVNLNSVPGSRNERARGSIMSAREIQDQKAIAREMFVKQGAHAKARRFD
jgi:hypothetical protein